MADEKFLSSLNSLKASDPHQAKRSRKKSSKATENENIARDLAFAVGEKPKIPNEQAELLQALKALGRNRNQNAKNANLEESSSILQTKRKLFGQQSQSVTAPPLPLGHANQAATEEEEIKDDNSHQISDQSSDSDDSDKADDSFSEEDTSIKCSTSQKTPEPLNDKSSTTTPVRKEKSCANCEGLVMKANPLSLDFVNTLLTFLRQNSSDSSQTMDDDHDAKVVGPVLTTPGQTKVELKRGCGVWLRNSTKAKLLLECENDPYKLTRKLLPEVFGDRLKSPGFTALGQGKDKIGLDDTALKGIYDFVRRNSNVENPPGSNRKGESKKPFSYKVFVMEVNRKLGSSRRDRSKEKQKASKGSSKSYVKTPKKQEKTPQKNSTFDSPSKESHTWRVTPMKKGSDETRATSRTVPPATSTSNQINGVQERASDQQPNAPNSYKQDGQQPNTVHLPYTHHSTAAAPHTAPFHATPLHAAPHAAAFHSAPFHAPAQPMNYNMGQGYFYDAHGPGPSHTTYSQHSLQGVAGSQAQDYHNSFFPKDYLFDDDQTGTGNRLTPL